DDVAARRDRVEGDRGRVGAALAADEAGAGAARPLLELLLGGGAEGVGRADRHLAAVLAELLRELADRGRLPGAVDADDEDHGGAVVDVERRRRAEDRRDLLGEGGVQVAELLPGLEAPHELGGRRHADVRGEERLLEPLPGGRVARVERRDRELLGERAARARERVAQPPHEALPGDLGLVGPLGVAEELGPRACHRERVVATRRGPDARGRAGSPRPRGSSVYQPCSSFWTSSSSTGTPSSSKLRLCGSRVAARPPRKRSTRVKSRSG